MKKYNINYLEDFAFYDQSLLHLTKFNNLNINKKPTINQLVINLSFKPVFFNKMKSIPFIFLLELLTNQKPVLTKSEKNNIRLKVKKGKIVGCKVNLRKINLIRFFSYYWLSLLNMENYKYIISKTLMLSKNAFSFSLQDLFSFYQTKNEYNRNINFLDMTIITNTSAFEEKAFLVTSLKMKFEKPLN